MTNENKVCIVGYMGDFMDASDCELAIVDKENFEEHSSKDSFEDVVEYEESVTCEKVKVISLQDVIQFYIDNH